MWRETFFGGNLGQIIEGMGGQILGWGCLGNYWGDGGQILGWGCLGNYWGDGGKILGVYPPSPGFAALITINMNISPIIALDLVNIKIIIHIM